MSDIACIITNFFEDIEYTEPEKAFREAGHHLTVISHNSGDNIKGKRDKTAIQADRGIDDVSPGEFDALFIPGGFSPDQLRADERFVSFVKKFAYLEQPIFAICHGPQLLITAEVLQGRKVTGYTSIQKDLKHAGANVFDEEVVVCGHNLVTSRNPNDIPAFNQEVMKYL